MGVINTGNKIGQTIAFVRLLFAVVVALSCCSSGGFLMVRKEKYSKQVDGVITDNKCLPIIINEITKYSCTIDFKYTVNDKEYSGSKKKEYLIEPKIGNTIKIFYNPENPTDTSFSQGPPKLFGVGLISFACVLVMISFLLYFITKKVKGAGTILTGATAYDYFKG
jgi:hypothetical protein|tara:strand:- start:495 stop:992 length:498 start_codon:yes stop_codon:yes gene_type:complete